MIDEEMKNQFLEGVKRWAELQKTIPQLEEPKSHFFQVGRVEMNYEGKKTPYVVAVMVGKTEDETEQILDEIVAICEKYKKGDKDYSRRDDYSARTL